MVLIPRSALLVLGLVLVTAIPLAAADAVLRIGNPWLSLPIYDEAPRVYFTIQNPSTTAKRIVAATSPRCRSIELRIATFEGGKEGSKALEQVEIPAGGAAAFSARGYYLALIGSEKLEENDRVPIELELAGGTKVRFEVDARDE